MSKSLSSSSENDTKSLIEAIKTHQFFNEDSLKTWCELWNELLSRDVNNDEFSVSDENGQTLHDVALSKVALTPTEILLKIIERTPLEKAQNVADGSNIKNSIQYLLEKIDFESDKIIPDFAAKIFTLMHAFAQKSVPLQIEEDYQNIQKLKLLLKDQESDKIKDLIIASLNQDKMDFFFLLLVNDAQNIQTAFESDEVKTKIAHEIKKDYVLNFPQFLVLLARLEGYRERNPAAQKLWNDICSDLPTAIELVIKNIGNNNADIVNKIIEGKVTAFKDYNQLLQMALQSDKVLNDIAQNSLITDGGQSLPLLMLRKNHESVKDGNEFTKQLWTKFQQKDRMDQLDPKIFCQSTSYGGLLHEVIKENNAALVDWALGKINRLSEEDKQNILQQRDQEGKTALHIVSELGYDGSLEKLLKLGFNLDEKDNRGRTAFDLAKEKHFVNTCTILYKKRDFVNENELQEFAKSMQGQLTQVMPNFSQLSREDFEARKKIVFASIESNNSSLVRIAISNIKSIKDENIKAEFLDQIQDCLHLACELGYDGIVKILLESQMFDKERLDKDGMSPLMHAAKKGFKKTCEILFDHGAKIDSPSAAVSPLYLAITNHRETVMEYLLTKNAQVNEEYLIEGSYVSPLKAAVKNNSLHAVKSLLNHGAFFAYEDEKGDHLYLKYYFEYKSKLPQEEQHNLIEAEKKSDEIRSKLPTSSVAALGSEKAAASVIQVMQP